MTPLTFYLSLGIAFLVGAWAYRMLESWVHRQRDLATGLVCSICSNGALNVHKCLRCKKHVCINCRWYLVVPKVRDPIFPKTKRTVCVKCATKEEAESFK